MCCSKPPSKQPKTHLSPLHALGRLITIVWAKTALHLESPSSLCLYKHPPRPKSGSRNPSPLPPCAGHVRPTPDESRRRPQPTGARHVVSPPPVRRRPARPTSGPCGPSRRCPCPRPRAASSRVPRRCSRPPARPPVPRPEAAVADLAVDRRRRLDRGSAAASLPRRRARSSGPTLPAPACPVASPTPASSSTSGRRLLSVSGERRASKPVPKNPRCGIRSIPYFPLSP